MLFPLHKGGLTNTLPRALAVCCFLNPLCRGFYFLILVSKGRWDNEDHVSGEAAERNAHPAGPDWCAAGFWCEWHLLTGKHQRIHWLGVGITQGRRKLEKRLLKVHSSCCCSSLCEFMFKVIPYLRNNPILNSWIKNDIYHNTCWFQVTKVFVT